MFCKPYLSEASKPDTPSPGLGGPGAPTWARTLLSAVQRSLSGSLLQDSGPQMPHIIPRHRPFQPAFLKASSLPALGPGQLQGA